MVGIKKVKLDETSFMDGPLDINRKLTQGICGT